MPVTDQAFVTLATNDFYCHGALVLGQSLRNHKTSRRLAILITPQVSREMRAALRTIFDSVVDVKEIDSNDLVHLTLLKRLELGVTFTKLHCWTLTQYSKCVFMDADTLVLCNVDELFERQELSAAPDSGWPDCFNSGVFVFQPSLKTFKHLLQFASEHGSFDGGDQGLLNSFFSSWATKDINKHLPFIYNLSTSTVYTYAPAFQHFGKDTKVIHFLGPAKPWNYNYNPQTRTVTSNDSTSVSENQLPFLELWWITYRSSILPLLEKFQEPPIQQKEPERNNDELTSESKNPLFNNSLTASTNSGYISESVVNTSCELSAKNNIAIKKDECSLESDNVEPSKSFMELSVQPVLLQTTNEFVSPVAEGTIQPEAKESSAENERRKWEDGHIDYLGKDAFENIKKKLDAFLL
ncbi:PREDICTED: glycogenin-1-like [Thamnophis sirtalis]|uniref:glycogenin glucosyltransferase n=1 Tax=Thamnophis sirtalis TaxID=35019 RepID=A0A6I9YCP0_9SAUR|nr:PREDICTED: glycogenin-1-like [Thamnophis sirtalis]XP_013921805.1 PREDICTED: glycogenin-1-like [Thamnophis sirtalis]